MDPGAAPQGASHPYGTIPFLCVPTWELSWAELKQFDPCHDCPCMCTASSQRTRNVPGLAAGTESSRCQSYPKTLHSGVTATEQNNGKEGCRSWSSEKCFLG